MISRWVGDGHLCRSLIVIFHLHCFPQMTQRRVLVSLLSEICASFSF